MLSQTKASEQEHQKFNCTFQLISLNFTVSLYLSYLLSWIWNETEPAFSIQLFFFFKQADYPA